MLSKLNEEYQRIIEVIPNRYPFQEGETGFNIGDGGEDMFDGGNMMSTELEESIQYSNNVISQSDAFGKESRYFTRKFSEGLFAFGAQNRGAE